MFKYKNAMISMAVVAMLAACGGGGGGGDDGRGSRSGSDADRGGAPVGGGDKVITDANLSGAAVSLNDAGILVPQSGTPIPVTYNDFNSDVPRDATHENAGGYGTYTGDPRGAASPLEFFGVRVLDAAADAEADDSKPGRLVFQLRDNDDVAVGERESLSIEIDKVVTTRTAGEVSVALGEGAQVHLVARNSSGQQSGVVSIDATDAMITVVDNEGTNDIVLNVDAIVAAAAAQAQGTDKAVVDSVSGFGSTVTEPFVVSMTLTNVDFSAGGTATEGTNVKVGSRDTVSGEGGVNGYVQSIAPDAGGGA